MAQNYQANIQNIAANNGTPIQAINICKNLQSYYRCGAIAQIIYSFQNTNFTAQEFLELMKMGEISTTGGYYFRNPAGRFNYANAAKTIYLRIPSKDLTIPMVSELLKQRYLNCVDDCFEKLEHRLSLAQIKTMLFKCFESSSFNGPLLIAAIFRNEKGYQPSAKDISDIFANYTQNQGYRYRGYRNYPSLNAFLEQLMKYNIDMTNKQIIDITKLGSAINKAVYTKMINHYKSFSTVDDIRDAIKSNMNYHSLHLIIRGYQPDFIFQLMIQHNYYYLNDFLNSNKSKINFTIHHLEHLCSLGCYMETIRYIVTQKKVKPNLKCLYYLARDTHGYSAQISFLMKNGVAPDFKYLMYASGQCKDRGLALIAAEYQKAKQDDEKINENSYSNQDVNQKINIDPDTDTDTDSDSDSDSSDSDSESELDEIERLDYSDVESEGESETDFDNDGESESDSGSESDLQIENLKPKKEISKKSISRKKRI